MRDLVVRESLRNLAEEASEKFQELVRSGEEVPYEVREPGQGSPLATYAPLTDRFIRDRSAMVARMEAFGAAKSAITNAGIARPYLESVGLESAGTEGRDAEDAIVAFLCQLWDGRSDFAYEPSRVDSTIAAIEAAADAAPDEVEVVVPLIGLRMNATRLELAEATIVRADTVDAPDEVSAPEGSGRAGWETGFLVTTRCKVSDIEPRESDDSLEPPTTELAERFARIVTALRLFKAGGVGLGPHAWIRSGGGRWRRIATGAGRPRQGPYRLTDTELGELAGLTRVLQKLDTNGAPPGLDRAISRFEAGLGRDRVLDALNDHLLALRFLLEGDGPAKTSMPWRVGALCAEPSNRDEVRATVERGLALERELWSGDPALGYDGRTPLDVAAEVEDFTRAIIRDAACGHLGSDLRATADEILLADGLAAGEGSASQRGETSEWGLGEVPPEIVIEKTAPAPERSEPTVVEVSEVDPPIEAEAKEEAEMSATPYPAPEEYDGEQQELELAEETSAAPPKRATDGWTPFVLEGGREDSRDEEPAAAEEESAPEPEKEPVMEASPAYEDWLEGNETLEFPKREPGPAMRLLDQRPEERRRMSDRVASLFPDPETTDWSIGELGHDRRRRGA
jgi:hypothetical protein